MRTLSWRGVGRGMLIRELRRMIVDARAKQKPLASDLDAFADQMG